MWVLHLGAPIVVSWRFSPAQSSTRPGLAALVFQPTLDRPGERQAVSQLDGLFRSYMSPAVATALLADPAHAGLGGQLTEVSVLMAEGGHQHRPRLGRQHRADQMRNFTAIGDTTNVAARLESLADPGQVVVGPRTWEQIRDRARAELRGPLAVKGKERPIPVYVLRELEEE